MYLMLNGVAPSYYRITHDCDPWSTKISLNLSIICSAPHSNYVKLDSLGLSNHTYIIVSRSLCWSPIIVFIIFELQGIVFISSTVYLKGFSSEYKWF